MSPPLILSQYDILHSPVAGCFQITKKTFAFALLMHYGFRGDLWQSWTVGADHFESELLDADYALNGFNWLWLSCSGFFYQYFRCYSPVVFQKKNDPNGNYIRKWVPELANLPAKYIYEPWKANVSILNAAGVKLGKNYKAPTVSQLKGGKAEEKPKKKMFGLF